MTSQEPNSYILLAEDNAADEALVREALQEHGIACDLRVVKDGAQAIAFIRNLDASFRSDNDRSDNDRSDNDRTHPQLDLLLLDMHLPRYDGTEILSVLRSTEHYAQKPVIVMTSSPSPGLRAAADKHAAMHYFRKPSSLAEFMLLGGIVRDVLAGIAPGAGDHA